MITKIKKINNRSNKKDLVYSTKYASNFDTDYLPEICSYIKELGYNKMVIVSLDLLGTAVAVNNVCIPNDPNKFSYNFIIKNCKFGENHIYNIFLQNDITHKIIPFMFVERLGSAYNIAIYPSNASFEKQEDLSFEDVTLNIREFDEDENINTIAKLNLEYIYLNKWSYRRNNIQIINSTAFSILNNDDLFNNFDIAQYDCDTIFKYISDMYINRYGYDCLCAYCPYFYDNNMTSYVYIIDKNIDFSSQLCKFISYVNMKFNEYEKHKITLLSSKCFAEELWLFDIDHRKHNIDYATISANLLKYLDSKYLAVNEDQFHANFTDSELSYAVNKLKSLGYNRVIMMSDKSYHISKSISIDEISTTDSLCRLVEDNYNFEGDFFEDDFCNENITVYVKNPATDNCIYLMNIFYDNDDDAEFDDLRFMIMMFDIKNRSITSKYIDKMIDNAVYNHHYEFAVPYSLNDFKTLNTITRKKKFKSTLFGKDTKVKINIADDYIINKSYNYIFTDKHDTNIYGIHDRVDTISGKIVDGKYSYISIYDKPTNNLFLLELTDRDTPIIIASRTCWYITYLKEKYNITDIKIGLIDIPCCKYAKISYTKVNEYEIDDILSTIKQKDTITKINNTTTNINGHAYVCKHSLDKNPSIDADKKTILALIEDMGYEPQLFLNELSKKINKISKKEVLKCPTP